MKLQRTTVTHVRMNPIEKDLFVAYVNRLNQRTQRKFPGVAPVTQSEILRHAVQILTDRHLDINDSNRRAINNLANDIRRIGVNINQLAHAYNAGQLTERPVDGTLLFRDLAKELENVCELVLQLHRDGAAHNRRFRRSIELQVKRRRTR